MPKDAADLMEFLPSIALFGGLEKRTLEKIISMLAVQELEPGAQVCKQGEPGRAMFVVRSGEAVVYRENESGRRARLIRMGPGEFFGEMTLVDIMKRSATVIVEKRSVLLTLGNKDLYRLYTEDVAGYVMVLQNLCRELSRRLRTTNLKLATMAEEAGDENTLNPPCREAEALTAMRRLKDQTLDVTVDLDGQPIAACAGENAAAALLAAGEAVFSRSIKYHRPRGPFCLTGACAHCLMRIDGVPNLPVCQAKVHSGMRLERQNAFPSAKVDVFSATDWLFPRGLNHHELFAGVPIAEQVMAKVARQLAGLGTLPDTVPPPREPAEVLRCERLIVGAGPAGLAAAQVFEETKASWLLLEREQFAGGRLAWAAPEFGAPGIWQPPDEKVRYGATAVGFFEDDDGRFLAVVRGERLSKIYPRQLLLAQGGTPQLLTFENNDLPGIFAARALGRLIRLHHLLPGGPIAVVGDAAEAKLLATLIVQAGGKPVAVGAEPKEAHGRSEVTGLTALLEGKEVEVDCEAIAICAPPAPSFELARQGGAHVNWSERERLFVVEADAGGRTAHSTLFVAGELKGAMSAAAAAETGLRAAKAMLEAPR